MIPKAYPIKHMMALNIHHPRHHHHHHNHQYSFYVIHVGGVQPILIRLEYQKEIDVRNVMLIIMNYLAFLSCQMNRSLLIIVTDME
jgi:hypothetical protein